jgi:hypothetical protein
MKPFHWGLLAIAALILLWPKSGQASTSAPGATKSTTSFGPSATAAGQTAPDPLAAITDPLGGSQFSAAGSSSQVAAGAASGDEVAAMVKAWLDTGRIPYPSTTAKNKLRSRGLINGGVESILFPAFSQGCNWVQDYSYPGQLPVGDAYATGGAWLAITGVDPSDAAVG